MLRAHGNIWHYYPKYLRLCYFCASQIFKNIVLTSNCAYRPLKPHIPFQEANIISMETYSKLTNAQFNEPLGQGVL